MADNNSGVNVYGPSTVVLFNGGVKSSVLVDLALQNSKQVYGLFIRPKSGDLQQANAADEVTKFHEGSHQKFSLCTIQMDYLRFRGFEIQTKNRGGPINHDFGFYHQAVLSAVTVAWHMKAERVTIGLNTLENMPPSTLNALYNLALNMSEDKIKLEFPLVNKSLNDIIDMAISLHTPIHATWSCYNNGEIRCNNCYGCITYKDAMEDSVYLRRGLVPPHRHNAVCGGPPVFEGL